MTAHVRCPSCGRINRVRNEGSSKKPVCGHCQAELDLSGAPIHLDDEGARRLVASSPVPVLIDFYADWCGPCRSLAPSLAEVGRRNAGRLLVVKIDTDKNPGLASSLGVKGIPALFVFKGGQVVDKASGAIPLPALESLVRPHLPA